MNHSNQDRTSSAESEEGRPLIKENAGQSNTCPTQSGEACVSQGLTGVRAKTGSPQGSVISPLLANIYLHYSFDLWVNAWRKKWAQGEVVVIRFADDTIVGFQYQRDADRFLENLRERLGKFGLELHPDKTAAS